MRPCALPETTASTMSPRISSTTTLARIARLARRSSSPRDRTSAVMTTLFATIAAAMNMASTGGRRQRSAIPPAIMKENVTPQTET